MVTIEELEEFGLEEYIPKIGQYIVAVDRYEQMLKDNWNPHDAVIEAAKISLLGPKSLQTLLVKKNLLKL